MVRVAASVPWDGLAFAATPDLMPLTEAEVLARAVARYEPSDAATRLLAERAADARAGQDFLDLFQIPDARQWDPHTAWAQVTAASRLRAPLGKNPTTGKTVWLDLKEGAEGGMGPHGMLTGQIGSGKSETLVSYVLALAMLYPPEVLQLLLGDFKGETAMMALADLPHCQGVVSNLAESASKLDRIEQMLYGEVERREEILKAVGYKDVRDYERARATTRPDLEPLGALLIVLDEFSELLRIRPSLAATFDVVARKGRGLWMHILNASQRVETGRMGGMISQQTYSIGMKLKDAGQSRQAIGSTKAFDSLKGAPQGTGFLVFDEEHTLFRSFYVSAPFVPPVVGKAQRRQQEGQHIDPHLFGVDIAPLPIDIEVGEDVDEDAEAERAAQAAADSADVDAPTVVSVLVGQLREAGRTSRPMHHLWWPALDEVTAITIDEMAAEFWDRDWLAVTENSGLVVPYAREDDPRAHTQGLLSADLSGSQGNVAVVGATQSGKSTAVQTLMAALAVSHSPQRVQFYGIDLGGGKLQNMAGLPHVSGVAGQGNMEKIGRVLSEVERLLADRMRHWEMAGITLEEFRARKFAGKPGEVPEDGHGDIFFIIDNLAALKVKDLALHQRITDLGASSALNYGVHLIATNDQWITLPTALNAKFGTRIELRMASAVESEMGDRDLAKKVPDQPGRGVKKGGRHLLFGTPVAGQTLPEQSHGFEQDSVQSSCELIAQQWAARGIAPAPPLPTLPPEIGLDDLDGDLGSGVLKLGMGELALQTVGVNLAESPHFYAVGSNGSGRSTVLRTLIASIQNSFSPQEAKIIAFDPDMKLGSWIDPAYLQLHLSSPQDVAAACAHLAKRLDERKPPAEASAEERAKWRFSGPRYFIVVDDVNLLNVPGSSHSSLLSPLESVIARGRQIGTHVLATINNANWMGSGMHNKVVKGLDAAGSGVLILDGRHADGAIVDGIRAAPRVPGRGELVYRKSGRQLVQVAVRSARDTPESPGADSW
ncbi:MAG: type VII secretion protein EccCb [Actinomycetia bacterium]|nr:type VII secretion protein EccCb [Actinomycetes bacterium]